MYMVYIWVAILAVGLILEAVESGTLVTIWFSVGAIIPLIMSFFGITEFWYIALEVIVFGTVTILSLVFLRRVARKTLFKNNKEKTNMDLYIGKKFKVVRVDGDLAYIKINGVEYRAVDDNGESVALNENVVLLKIMGNKVVVDKINKEEGVN